MAHHTDVFLTHDWGRNETNHLRVRTINEALTARGYRTWFDNDRMTGDIYEQMASGIDNTKCVIVFITERYRRKINGPIADDYCKYEFQYAMQQKSSEGIVCVVMEEGMRRPKGWGGLLGMYCANKLYIDMSGDLGHEVYLDRQVDMLCHQISNCGVPLPDPNRRENEVNGDGDVNDGVLLQEAVARLEGQDGYMASNYFVTEYGSTNVIDLDGEDLVSIVIDNGSYSIKSGFSGFISDEYPRVVTSSVIGEPREESEDLSDLYVGQRAQNLREALNLTYPIKDGVIHDWESMEKIWNHIYQEELQRSPLQHPVMLTESAHNKDRRQREKTIEIMFELFHVPAFYLGTDSVLALYGQGHSTGISIDIGDHASYVVPVFEGYSIPNLMLPCAASGNELTLQVHEAMTKQGFEFCPNDIRVHKAKAAVCEIALDYNQLTKNDTRSKVFQLPDGNKFHASDERFDYGEAFFQPSLFGRTGHGLHQLIQQSVDLLNEPHANKELYASIVVTGGTCMIPGFASRLTKELSTLVSPEFDIQVIHGPNFGRDNYEIKQERKYGAWVGGAVLSSLTTFSEQWVTRDEYDDTGSHIVHRKCFI